MLKLILSSIKQNTVTIGELRSGEGFVRAKNSKEPFSRDKTFVYIKLPNTARSLGIAPTLKFWETKPEECERIGFCFQNCCCSIIEPDEPLYRAELTVGAQVIL